MPNTKSAKKRWRQDQKRRLANRSKRSFLATQLKKVHQAVEAGDGTEAEAAYRLAVKKLDQSAAKGLIHPNKASRLKSRYSRRLKSMQSASKGEA